MCVWLAKSILETEDKALVLNWINLSDYECAVCFNIRVDDNGFWAQGQCLPWYETMLFLSKLRKITLRTKHNTLILKSRWTANWRLSIITSYREFLFSCRLHTINKMKEPIPVALSGDHSCQRKESPGMCPHGTWLLRGQRRGYKLSNRFTHHYHLISFNNLFMLTADSCSRSLWAGANPKRSPVQLTYVLI